MTSNNHLTNLLLTTNKNIFYFPKDQINTKKNYENKINTFKIFTGIQNIFYPKITLPSFYNKYNIKSI